MVHFQWSSASWTSKSTPLKKTKQLGKFYHQKSSKNLEVHQIYTSNSRPQKSGDSFSIFRCDGNNLRLWPRWDCGSGWGHCGRKCFSLGRCNLDCKLDPVKETHHWNWINSWKVSQARGKRMKLDVTWNWNQNFCVFSAFAHFSEWFSSPPMRVRSSLEFSSSQQKLHGWSQPLVELIDLNFTRSVSSVISSLQLLSHGCKPDT